MAEKQETALAVAEPEKKELTKKDMLEGDKRYREEILSPCLARRGDARKAVVRAYWEMGAYAAKLLEDPHRYGKATVQAFAEDMSDEHHKIGPQLVYKWIQFHKTYSQEALEIAQRKQLSWSAIEELVDVKDLAERMKLEDQVAAGKLPFKDLRTKKKNLNKAAKKKGQGETRGGLHASAAFRNLGILCAEFERKLDDYRDALKKHDKMEEGASKAKADIARKEVGKALKSVAGLIEKVLALD